jgi:outer membrane protein assembly factor BamB
MITPRGNMATFVNGSTIFTIGGAKTSTPNDKGVAVIEALHLDMSDPCDGTWESWSNMNVPRVNPTIAFAYDGIVDFLNVSEPLSTTELLPSLPATSICNDNDLLGALDSETVVLICYQAKETLWLDLSSNSWMSVSETPLSPWTIQSYQIITSEGLPLFMANLAEGSFFFYFEGGNVTQFVCYSDSPCPDSTITTLLTEPSWVCFGPFGSSLALKWKYLANGDVIAGPSIGATGTVYFGTSSGIVYALNLTGSVVWSCLVSYDGVGSELAGTPTVVVDPETFEETLYVGAVHFGV